VHEILTVTKNIDKASPGLAHALSMGQNLQSVVLRFYWLDPQEPDPSIYYIITLSNARVVDFEHKLIHRGNDEFVQLDVVSFVYEEIEWNWMPDGIIYDDTWIPQP
jgi:type VI secretion system secreted protein Hcp